MKDEKKLTSPEEKLEDNNLENSLRPKTFKDYIGQLRIKKNLDIAILAAKKEKNQ